MSEKLGFFDRLSDYFVAGSDETNDSIATAREVAAGQQAILDRQAAQGRVDYFEHNRLRAEIDASDEIIEDYQDQHDDLVRVIGWKGVLLIVAIVFGVFLYFGGGVWLLKKFK